MMIIMKHLLLLPMCLIAAHAQTVRQIVCAENETCNYMDLDCGLFRNPQPGQHKIGSIIYCLTESEQQICHIKNSTCKIGKTDRNGVEVRDGDTSSNDGLTPYERWCKKWKEIKRGGLGSRAGIIPLREAQRVTGLCNMKKYPHIDDPSGDRSGAVGFNTNLNTNKFYHWRLKNYPLSLGMLDPTQCLYFKKYAREDDFKNKVSSFALILDSKYPAGSYEDYMVVPRSDTNLRMNELGHFVSLSSPGSSRILVGKLAHVCENYTHNFNELALQYELNINEVIEGVHQQKVNCFDKRLNGCSDTTTTCFRNPTEEEITKIVSVSGRTHRNLYTPPVDAIRTTTFIPALTNVKTVMSDIVFNGDLKDLIVKSRKMVKVGTKLIIDNDTGSTTTSTIKHQEKFAKFTTFKNTYSHAFGLEMSVKSSVPFLATGMFKKRVETSNVGQGQNEEELHHLETKISVPPSTVLQAQVVLGVVEFQQHFTATITVTAEHPQLLQDFEIENVPATGEAIWAYLKNVRADLETPMIQMMPFSVVLSTTGDVEANYATGLQVKISCIPVDRC